MDLGPSVEHGDYESFDRKFRIDLVLHEPDGLQQLPEAFEGEELRLDRDHDRVSRSQGVDRDETEGRGAVDDDEIVVVPDGGEPLLEDRFAVRSLDHFDLSPYEVDVGRDHLEIVEFRLDQGVPYVDRADHHLIERPLLVIVRREVQP